MRGSLLVDPAAVEALLKTAREDRNPKVRGAVICEALRLVLDDHEQASLMLGFLRDPEPQVREAAARAMSPGPYLSRHVPEIRELLRAEKQPAVREAISRLIEDWERHTADKLPDPEPGPGPQPAPKPPEPPEVF